MTPLSRPLARLWGAIAGVALLASPWASELAAALPGCPFRAVSGWPCAGCGTGRALVALAAGHPFAALAWNPLAGVGAVAFVVGGLVAAGADLAGRPLGEPRSFSPAVRAAALVALGGDWIYLVCAGR